MKPEKINLLTPEQENLIPIYRHKWVNWGVDPNDFAVET